jgi:hypothetical protein
MWLEVTPEATHARFMGLADVRDAKSDVQALASFRVADGRAGVDRQT